MKSVFLCISILLLIPNIANGVPPNYNAFTEEERKSQEKRCIKSLQDTSVSYELVQTAGDNDHLAIRIDGKVKYIEKKRFYPKYSQGIVVDIDGNRLDDIIFEYWPGTQGLALGSGIAVYLQRENADFEKLILPAERFSLKDIFDIDGNGIFEIVTAKLVKYLNHNYWVYRCWQIKDYQIMNVDAKFDFPRAIWFTFQPNQKLVDKETTRKIMNIYGYVRRPSSFKTLRNVLRDNDIDVKSIDRSCVNGNITSYAVLNNPKMFCMAYYLDNYLNFLGNKLYVNLLEKEQNKWIQNELNVKTLIPDKPYFHPGSIVKVTYSKNYVYLITHKNPSAGDTLILSNELEFQGALYGRLLATFDNGTIVYHNSQVHFAPTHYAEISIYNPLTKVNRKIYPIKPYQKIRLEHIKKVKAAYDKLGEDWFRCHNHHMNPELFNNHLIGKVAIDNDTNSLAFTIAYDNKDYWGEEDKLKLRSFRELQRRFAKVGVTEPLSDYLFISLYEDLMRTKRFWKTQDTVLKLFEDDPELHRMLQDAFKSEREKEKGENWRKHFISLDSNWENPEVWKKISGKIAVPPEYTKVVYIYQNAHIDKGITYKEILLSYLKKRYGDISISEYLEPKLLKEIFKK